MEFAEQEAIEDLRDGMPEEPVVDHHFAVATAIYPTGVVMRCPLCERTITGSVKQAAHWFAYGAPRWPVCCGQTMQIGGTPIQKE
jgi:hypothetical protein